MKTDKDCTKEDISSREKRIKRLLYQSWYRGCRETDKILGNFAKKYLENFSTTELNMFEEILAESDNNIYNFVSGKEELPERLQNNLILKKLIKNYK